MILLTDWGSYLNYYQEIQFNWRELYDKAGLRGAIFRGRQEQISPNYGNYSTIRNIEAARQVVPVVGCYYWHYPDANQALWLAYYQAAIDKEQPDFIGVDLEQTQVWNGNAYVQVDPQKFSDTAQQLCEGLRDAYPEKQVIPYTRRDIVTSYSPPCTKWIGAFDGGWEAAGMDYGLQPYNLSWDQIKSFQCKVYPSGNLQTVDSSGVSWIPTWTKHMLWQYSGRIRPPYTWGTLYGHQYDWNAFMGTEAELMAWVKKQTLPSEPTWEQSVDAYLRTLTPPYTGPGPA